MWNTLKRFGSYLLPVKLWRALPDFWKLWFTVAGFTLAGVLTIAVYVWLCCVFGPAFFALTLLLLFITLMTVLIH